MNFCCCFIRTLLAKYYILVKSELGWLVVNCNGKVSRYQLCQLGKVVCVSLCGRNESAGKGLPSPHLCHGAQPAHPWVCLD